MSTSIAMTAGVSDLAHAHLIRADGDEDLCFALWEPSRGQTRTSAIIAELIVPEGADRILRGNVAFTAGYFERAIAIARQTGCGLAIMHSHPPNAHGWQGLSPDDHDAEAGIAGAVAAATDLPLVGLTVAGGDRHWSGRFWERGAPRRYEPRYCETVRLLGAGLHLDFHDEQRPPPVDRHRLARTVTAWGHAAQAHLARVHVGIVGLGSVGSIVAESLARIGIERVSLLDFDSIEEVNLDRTLNAYEDDVAAKLSKADVAARAARRAATSRRFAAIPLELSVCENAGYKEALDCDVLFSCVDRPWPRSVLNFIAYAHLIPVVDGGIHVSRTPSGRMRGADWKAHLAATSRRCLTCLGQYDPGLVQADREGHLDDPSYIESLPLDHPVRANENVFAFSLGAASLEVLQFLSLVIGPGGVHDFGAQTYHATIGTMDIDRTECDPGCVFPTLVGRGDRAGHPGVAPHPAAEKARHRRQLGVRDEAQETEK